MFKKFLTTVRQKNTKETEVAISAGRKQAEETAASRHKAPIAETRELRTVESSLIIEANTPLTLADMIDEDDKIVETVEMPNRLGEVWQMAARTSIRNLRQLTDGLDGKIYAGISKNEKGERQIEFCQQYNNGGFSEKMILPQAGLLSSFKEKMSEGNKKSSRAAQKFSSDAENEYYKKFAGNHCEMLDVEEILKLLFCSYTMLPVYNEDGNLYERQEFFEKVKKAVETLSIQNLNTHKSYFVVDESDITYVARELHLTKAEFIKKLKEYGLLYLSKSARGYQNNVRFKNPDGTTYTHRAYCIYNLNYLASEYEDKGIGSDF